MSSSLFRKGLYALYTPAMTQDKNNLSVILLKRMFQRSTQYEQFLVICDCESHQVLSPKSLGSLVFSPSSVWPSLL